MVCNKLEDSDILP